MLQRALSASQAIEARHDQRELVEFGAWKLEGVAGCSTRRRARPAAVAGTNHGIASASELSSVRLRGSPAAPIAIIGSPVVQRPLESTAWAPTFQNRSSPGATSVEAGWKHAALPAEDGKTYVSGEPRSMLA
jgi:hypothetical protein